jgi:hypothetical protein
MLKDYFLFFWQYVERLFDRLIIWFKKTMIELFFYFPLVITTNFVLPTIENVNTSPIDISYSLLPTQNAIIFEHLLLRFLSYNMHKWSMYCIVTSFPPIDQRGPQNIMVHFTLNHFYGPIIFDSKSWVSV